MKFQELARTRFSVRKFRKTPVDRSAILEIMETVRLAPSAVNFQPWHFIVVTSSGSLGLLHKTYAKTWIESAPVIIIACIDHNKSWKRGYDRKDFGDVDLGIAIDHLTLQAAELGLGTCWVCNFDSRLCQKSFNLPDYIEPIALLPMGYPEAESPAKMRNPVDEFVHWEKF